MKSKNKHSYGHKKRKSLNSNYKYNGYAIDFNKYFDPDFVQKGTVYINGYEFLDGEVLPIRTVKKLKLNTDNSKFLVKVKVNGKDYVLAERNDGIKVLHPIDDGYGCVRPKFNEKNYKTNNVNRGKYRY